MKFEHIFKPIKIGNVEIKNRTIFPPISTNFGSENGHLTEQYIAHYERIAQGGVGLVIIENVCIDFPNARHGKYEARMDSEEFLPDWIELVQRVHAAGVKISVELTHDGYSKKDVDSFSEEQIEEILKKYAISAAIAQKAGFDMVEIQGAHGLLPNKFLSHLTNHRKDKWEIRENFVLEIRRIIGETVGYTYPVTIRLAVDDMKAGGIDIEEGKRLTKLFSENGYAMIQADIGLGPKEYRLEPMHFKEGWRANLAKKIRPLPVPVAAIGVIRSPEMAEQILETMADMVVLGRTLIADPDWVNKVKNNEINLIRKCIGCSECIKARHDENVPIRCGTNPNVGNEETIKKADKVKNIAILGCGPAGLEATLIAAQRGHNVHLFCKDFGGQINIASVPPGKEKLRWLMEYFDNRLKLFKNIKLHEETYDKNEVLKIKPDAIIFATGAKPFVPFTLQNEHMHVYDEILKHEIPFKGKNIVVIGGGLVGCETANYLAKDNKVIIVEMLPEIAPGVEKLTKNHLLDELKDKNVEIHTNAKVIDLKNEVLIAVNSQNGEKITLKFDELVIATGGKPYVPFECTDIPSYYIGDAKSVRNIYSAISEGYKIAKGI
ncbi:MAG: FAD-dependent oxidoreductase [Candidatus Aenigmarchaeota archaeon]|nr:FAD-dependent oxidoreductase [Candidatus Aenigmarchaeota archaeon]